MKTASRRLTIAERLIEEYRQKRNELVKQFVGHSEPGPARVIPQLGHRFTQLPNGKIVPTMAGGSRQYFADVINDPPILSSASALVSTSEELLWAPADFTRIPANDSRPGKIYEVTAGGIATFASTGLISFTPRAGLLVSSPTMGVTVVPLNSPGVFTANAWHMKFTMVCRVIGAAGANSTFIGTGHCILGGVAGTAGAVNSHVAVDFGGTVATADASIAFGIAISKTLTVAGSFTTQYVYIQSLN